MKLTDQQSSRRRPAGSSRRLAIGHDVAAPVLLAGNGRIPLRSERAVEVARWFGLRRADPDARITTPAPALPEIKPGTITLITGPSGAGKSSLLRALRDAVPPDRPWIDLNAIPLPALPLVDCFGPEMSLHQALRLLSQCGLSEAWSCLRTPEELSDGQRCRLRAAIGIHLAAQAIAAGKRPVLACDEFGSLLDRVTAMIVSRNLRCAIDQLPGASALLATAHDDLQPALSPDVLVWCDFGVTDIASLRPAPPA